MGILDGKTNSLHLELDDLRRRERDFATLVAHLPVIIARFDRALRHVYVSPYVLSATGQKPEEFIGKTYRDLGMEADLVERWDAALNRCFETGQEGLLHFSFPAADGTHYYEGQIIPEKDPANRVITVLVINHDVTGARNAKLDLEVQNQRLSVLHKITQIMLGSLSFADALQRTVAEIKAAIDYPVVAIEFYEPQTDEMVIAAAAQTPAGEEGKFMAGKRLRLADTLSGAALVTRKAVLFPDPAAGPDTHDPRLQSLGIQTYLGLPLIADDAVVGVLSLAHSDRLPADQKFLGWLEQLADEIAALIKHKTLQYSLQNELEQHRQANAALTQKERFISLLIENLQGIVFRNKMSPQTDWRPNYISTGSLELTGYTPEEIVNSTLLQDMIDPPEDLHRLRKEMMEAVARGGVFDAEYRIRTAGGTLKWVQCRGHQVESSGDESLVEGILLDITPRKQAELNLLESRARLEALFNNPRIGIIFTDLNGAIQQCNVRMSELLGYSPAELMRKSADQVLHPDDLEDTFQAIDTLLRREVDSLQQEKRLVCKNRDVIWAELSMTPIYDSGGNIEALVGFVNDISSRKLVERALRQSEAKFRSVIEQAPDGFILINSEDRIIEWNQVMEVMTGYARPQVIGRKLKEIVLSLLNPKNLISDMKNSLDNMSGRLKTLLDGKRSRRIVNIEFTSLDGMPHVAQVSFLRAEFENGVISGAILRDITEQKHMENTLYQAQKMAGLGTMSAGIAHEINSPLQVITGISESILKRLETPEQEGEMRCDPEWLERQIQFLNRNAWRVAEVIRSLQEYARPAAAEMTPNDLNVIIRDALLLIEHQLKSRSNVTVETYFSQNLPQIICDRARITQVIFNLLTNARDAMPEGGEIFILTSYQPLLRQLIIEVSDNGVGIPDEIRDKIFDPFFTTKPVGEGSGLGLSIAASIVHSHGGQINVVSRPGNGARFTVLLPEHPQNARQPLTGVMGRYDE